MIDRRKDMPCQEFSAHMAELVAAGEDIFAHPHVRRCKLHRALLEDLEEIARVVRQMFPEVDPPDSVWEEIEAGMANGHHPDPIVSDPWPGWRVVFAAQVIEDYDPNASPPPSGDRLSRKKPLLDMQMIGGHRASPRREGRR